MIEQDAGEYRILGVDPGLTRSGWGVISCHRSEVRLLGSGVISTQATMDFPQRLVEIYNTLTNLIGLYKPQVLAVENVIYAENVRVALKLGHARGAILLAAAQKNLPIVDYAPKTIKESVTGNGNASKLQMQRMVQSILQLSELPTPHDIADAIAIALCHFHRQCRG